MLKHGLRALLLASALGGPVALAQSPAPLDTGDPVVATVDGTPIRRSDVIAVQRNLPAQFQQVPIELLFPAVIERLIDAKLLANAGKKERLQDDPDVKRQLAEFEERLIQNAYLGRRLESVVDEKSVRASYEEYIKNNPAKEEISARHILVQSEAQAKDVIAELKRGADFAAVASAKSIDPSGKQNGGDLGFFSREDMVPEFSEAAFKMKDGETSAVPVKSQFGWHVIKVEARRTASPSFEEMREQITNDMQQQAANAIVGKLREGATIERFGLDGAPRPK
jgi:peptidyl-prolyl cis-trans isomerase C